jgi:hypothetical protein
MCEEFCSWNEETHLGDLVVDGNVIKLTIRNSAVNLWSRYVWFSGRKHGHNNEVPGFKTKAWELSTSLVTISCWWSQFLQLEYITAQHWSVHSHSQKSCMCLERGEGEITERNLGSNCVHSIYSVDQKKEISRGYILQRHSFPRRCLSSLQYKCWKFVF